MTMKKLPRLIIQHGIPLPRKERKTLSSMLKRTLLRMAIGDSFTCYWGQALNARTVAWNLGIKIRTKVLCSDGGGWWQSKHRVWRIS